MPQSESQSHTAIATHGSDGEIASDGVGLAAALGRRAKILARARADTKFIGGEVDIVEDVEVEEQTIFEAPTY